MRTGAWGYGDVHTPGRITEGDVLRLDPSDRSPRRPAPEPRSSVR